MTHPGQHRSVRRRSPAVVATGIAAVIGFVLVTSVTAALTVPAVAITAQESLQSVLPANTALYVTADLNPGQGAQSQLSAFASQVTAGSDWARMLTPLTAAASSRHDGTCLKSTVNKATSNLFDLGHDTAFALIPAPVGSNPVRRHHRPSTLSRDFALNFVVVAPLDVHMTLLDALGGVSFTFPKHPVKHRGTSIYREVVPACDRAGGQVPSAYYAAIFKGYIVLGLQTATVKEIIDTGLGFRPALSSVKSAVESIAGLPSGATGGFFVNPTTLTGSPVLLRRLETWKVASKGLFDTIAHWGIFAGSTSVQSGGIHVTVNFPSDTGPIPTSPDPKGVPPTDLSTLLSQAGQPPPAIWMKRDPWAVKWLKTAGIHLPLQGSFERTAHKLDLHAAVIKLSAPVSPAQPTVTEDPGILFTGRAASAQQVGDSLYGVFQQSTTDSGATWPESGLLGAAGNTSPAGGWALLSPSLSGLDTKAGYTALWELNLDRQPRFVNQLLRLLPFPLNGWLREVVSLSRKSFSSISGSVTSRPLSGIDTLTLNMGTIPTAPPSADGPG
jgi:hypothetical protein